MLLIVDNYDSFTYNLVQYFGELGVEMRVVHNDEITLGEIESEIRPERVLILAGAGNAGHRRDLGSSYRAVYRQGANTRVCLGHQAIGQHFGGRVIRSGVPVHGKPTTIIHDGKTVFADIPDHFAAGRYHSLIVERESLPDCLEISAETPDGLIMGLRHRTKKIEGVQFHPESILTEHGRKLLQNFMLL